MSETSEEWELSKENIRPIQRGRNQKALKVALAAHPEDIILQQRQSFENELRTYSGDDPLTVWCEYIKWVEQNYPKGGREGHIKELIERCVSILKNEEKYYDDNRFVDILLKYADIGGKPVDVYTYMFSNRIGCKSAELFINWSWLLEQMGNLKKADEILNEGLRHRAEPHDKMTSYYKDFEIRLSEKIKTNVVDQNDCESENTRSAFAVLKPQKKKLAPISRTGEAVMENRKKPLLLGGKQQPQPKSTSASVKAPFRIFDSENINSSLPVQSRNISSAFSSEYCKENEQKPGKWNKVKVKPHNLVLKTPGEAKPEFQFHCDENEIAFQTPRFVPSTSKILTTRCRTPPSPMGFFESSDPLVRNMYPKNKIYGGAEEYSLEEIRAAEWFENKRKREQELLIQQHEEIVENSKAIDEPAEVAGKLAKQVELFQDHSVATQLELNDVENGMAENKFTDMHSTEKLEKNNGDFKYGSDPESKDKLNIFSLENENSSNEIAKTVQIDSDKTDLHSSNSNAFNSRSNKLSEKSSAVCSNNLRPDFNERNKIKSGSSLPFTFFHDPEFD